jgi:polar amino acid transport system substrate-binding protein
MVRLVLILLAVLLQAACWARAPAALPGTLRVCADTNEFAPFVFRERHGSARGPQVLGYDLDVLRRVLEPAGVHIEVELLPWARCVLQGARGDFPILLDGLRSPKRERDFLFPASHYGLTPLFVYLRAGPRPDVDSVTGLSHYRLCSQADYNYEPYGVPDRMITNRARTIEDAVGMLKLGRCQVLLQYAELLEANRAMGGADVLGDPALRSEPAQWIRHVELYYLVSKRVPYRQELLELIDRGVTRLKHNGELDRLRAKYQNQQK